MQIKPRIKCWRYSPFVDRANTIRMWDCEGARIIRSGTTPAKAFAAWNVAMKQRAARLKS